MDTTTASNNIFVRAPGLTLKDATASMGRHWGWMLAGGIAYVILGIVALSVPVASTVGLTYAIAAILVVSGVVNFIQAFKLRHEQGGLIRFLQSVLALAVGVFIFAYPGLGMLGLTIAMAFYFLVGSTMHWILAGAMAKGSPRGWLFVSAICSFVLGIYIIFTFPISALWVPGTLLGIEFLFSGASLIGLAFAARKLHKETYGADTHRMTSNYRPTGQAT